MKHWICTADSVDYLKTFIEAETKEEALDKFQDMLDLGLVPSEEYGEIDNKQIQEIVKDTTI
jgi:hypothetical protein